MTSPDLVQGALAKSVHAMDTSRRVGWGKFYAETEKVDDLSRDLNMARSDFDLMSRFAGYLYGALTVAAPGVMSALPESVDRLGILGMLPEASMTAGRQAARTRRRRRPRLDDEMTEFISELILDRREKLSEPNRGRKWDPRVGSPYWVTEDAKSTQIRVQATAQGGAIIDCLRSEGKFSARFTSDERDRLLNLLKAIEIAQDRQGEGGR